MARVPERIASGVYRVDAMGLSNSISVLLIDGDDWWTLVDTGMRASVLRIQEALAALGAGPNELRRIYLYSSPFGSHRRSSGRVLVGHRSRSSSVRPRSADYLRRTPPRPTVEQGLPVFRPLLLR